MLCRCDAFANAGIDDREAWRARHLLTTVPGVSAGQKKLEWSTRIRIRPWRIEFIVLVSDSPQIGCARRPVMQTWSDAIIYSKTNPLCCPRSSKPVETRRTSRRSETIHVIAFRLREGRENRVTAWRNWWPARWTVTSGNSDILGLCKIRYTVCE